jgi:hypothetical protein
MNGTAVAIVVVARETIVFAYTLIVRVSFADRVGSAVPNEMLFTGTVI